MREAELKSAVDDYLNILQNQGKVLFLRLNSGDFIEVRGETRRRVRGCPKGTADYIVIMPNRVIFLELKSDVGKQSKEQKEFQGKVEEQGALYYVVRSVDEVMEVIE